MGSLCLSFFVGTGMEVRRGMSISFYDRKVSSHPTTLLIIMTMKLKIHKSHRNHRGNICGVDFIWLQNPQKFQKLLKDSFVEAILGNITNLLHKVITENGGPMPEFLKTKGSTITYSHFCQALVELGISGQPDGSLSDEDVKEIWDRIDADGDGIADVPNLVTEWTLCCSLQHEEHDKEMSIEKEEDLSHCSAATIGFVVKKATLFPREAEEGKWPENYLLSDHALLTVEFDVVEMSCV